MLLNPVNLTINMSGPSRLTLNTPLLKRLIQIKNAIIFYTLSSIPALNLGSFKVFYVERIENSKNLTNLIEFS